MGVCVRVCRRACMHVCARVCIYDFSPFHEGRVMVNIKSIFSNAHFS